MKKTIAVVSFCLVFSNLAFAEKGENFNKIKSQIASQLDKKIAQLNSHKSCVASANQKEDLKKCVSSNMEKMKALRADSKAARSVMKEERKAKKKKNG